MQFLAGNWKIILAGPNGSVNMLVVKNLDDQVIEEIEGKFLGIAPPQEPHKVNFSEPADGSRIHFRRKEGVTYVSPPLSDSSEWLEGSYTSMFDVARPKKP